MKPSPFVATGIVYQGYTLELALHSVKLGWRSLVQEAFEIKDTWAPLIKIIQVKEKDGALRIYTDLMHDELDRRICDIQKRSLSVCEECAGTGTLYKTKTGKYYTRCSAHSKHLIFCGA